jgi:hypothetical protein
MSVLSTAIRNLLNKFSDSQPALQQKDLPRASSGLLLGDYIEAAATAGTSAAATALAAANAAQVTANAALPAALVGQTVTSATGEIAVVGMTATGGAIATLASTGEALTVVCGVDLITVNVIGGAVVNAAAVNWIAVKLA